MKRVLFVQLTLQPPGGGNAVGAWMLEALRSEYALSTLTWEPVDVETINRFYGTSLSAADLTIVPLPPAWRHLLDRLPLPLYAVKLAVLTRVCHDIHAQYDILMSAHRVADFGRPGIQYLHHPWDRQLPPKKLLRYYHGPVALVHAYNAACRWWADFSLDRMRENLTLVNSEWTGNLTRQQYGVDCVTVYPPVPGEFPQVPWAEREDGFVCVGRFVPEKELDRVIDILIALRTRGHAVHLHLVGTAWRGDRYRESIIERARRHADWIAVEENLPRRDLVRLLATHRYGIHGMSHEHFGIAVGEMVRAGCITFVPDGGGQVEIVGDAPQLRYRSVDDAVEKIGGVLRSAPEQHALRAHLAGRAPLFSAEHFMERIRAIVRSFQS